MVVILIICCLCRRLIAPLMGGEQIFQIHLIKSIIHSILVYAVYHYDRKSSPRWKPYGSAYFLCIWFKFPIFYSVSTVPRISTFSRDAEQKIGGIYTIWSLFNTINLLGGSKKLVIWLRMFTLYYVRSYFKSTSRVLFYILFNLLMFNALWFVAILWAIPTRCVAKTTSTIVHHRAYILSTSHTVPEWLAQNKRLTC